MQFCMPFHTACSSSAGSRQATCHNRCQLTLILSGVTDFGRTDTPCWIPHRRRICSSSGGDTQPEQHNMAHSPQQWTVLQQQHWSRAAHMLAVLLSYAPTCSQLSQSSTTETTRFLSAVDKASPCQTLPNSPDTYCTSLQVAQPARSHEMSDSETFSGCQPVPHSPKLTCPGVFPRSFAILVTTGSLTRSSCSGT